MRNGTLRNRDAAVADDENFDRKVALWELVLRLLIRNPRDSFVAIVATAAVHAMCLILLSPPNYLRPTRGPVRGAQMRVTARTHS